jgi:hypothetical protein
MARMQHTISSMRMITAVTHMDHFMLNLFFLNSEVVKDATATAARTINMKKATSLYSTPYLSTV